MVNLKNRNETYKQGNDTYKMVVDWSDYDKACIFGQSPTFAYIRKNGMNWAWIDCYSNDTRFSVRQFNNLYPSKWRVAFSDKDINRVPLREIIERVIKQTSKI